MKLIGIEPREPCLGDSGLLQHDVGNDLIHTSGGGGHIAAHKRNARKLQKALYGSILAVFSVKGGNHAVNFFHGIAVVRIPDQQTPDRGIRH